MVTFRSLFDAGFVMVFEADLVGQVLRGSPDRLRAGEANALLAPVVGERSVLLADGAAHLRQRKLLLPPFHGERLRAHEATMVAAADRAIDGWPVGEPWALLPSLQELTLEIIARAVFGVTDEQRRHELQRRIRAMLGPTASRRGVLTLVLTGGRRGSAAGPRFAAQRRAVDEAIFGEIAQRRTEPDLAQREDVLSMLLQAREEDGAAMDDRELRDELVTLLVAGHETTASALAWALELLLHDPAQLERARAAALDGDDAHLDAVVKETLRLRPVISGIGRIVRGQEPFELGEHAIPPGVEINPSIAALHRRADRYPEVGTFRPERFLGPDAPAAPAWLPFGGGTRRCLGASFASFEMRVVIRRVLERARLEPAGRRRERGVRRGIVFVPKNGVRVRQPAAPAPGAPPP